MYNLYLKKKNKLVFAKEKPFKTEEELEKYLMNEKGIISDIFILKRQVKAGRDIPDMIGVDRDNNIVIIENKNVQVNEDILPQILRYAIWAETTPDSIKAMWLEEKNKPEDIEIDWDNINIKVLVFAPSIKLTVPRLLKKINYNVELIEVKRFELENSEIILMNRFEEEPDVKIKTTRGLEIYDKEFYKQYRNNKSVDLFFKVADDIEKITKNNKWNLEKKFNKCYVGFKSGFFNLFGVHWVGTRSFELFLKLKESQFSKIKKICPYDITYDKRWKQATIRYDSNVKIKNLEKVFKLVYSFFMDK